MRSINFDRQFCQLCLDCFTKAVAIVSSNKWITRYCIDAKDPKCAHTNAWIDPWQNYSFTLSGDVTFVGVLKIECFRFEDEDEALCFLQIFSSSTRPGRRSWLRQHCHAITVTDLSMRTMSKSWTWSSFSFSSSNLKLDSKYRPCSNVNKWLRLFMTLLTYSRTF